MSEPSMNARVRRSLEPFCDRYGIDASEHGRDLAGARDLPQPTDWYSSPRVQDFVMAAGNANTVPLDHVHGIMPDYRNRAILISVDTPDSGVLDQIVEVLASIAPDNVEVVVRPTCVDPDVSQKLRHNLAGFKAGAPNSRSVDPLTGQLAIMGTAEAYERLRAAIQTDPSYRQLDDSIKSRQVLHVPGRPRRLRPKRRRRRQ